MYNFLLIIQWWLARKLISSDYHTLLSKPLIFFFPSSSLLSIYFFSVNFCFLFVSHSLAYILPNPKTSGSIHLDDPDQDQWSKITRIMGNQRNEESTLGKDHQSWSGSLPGNIPWKYKKLTATCTGNWNWMRELFECLKE